MTTEKSKFWSSLFGVTLRKITGTEKKYQDQFRVRRETLVNGEQRCYPEYRGPGITTEWEQIVCINNEHYMSSHIIYEEAYLTLEGARKYIAEFRKKLEHERAKLLLREEILSSEEYE